MDVDDARPIAPVAALRHVHAHRERATKRARWNARHCESAGISSSGVATSSGVMLASSAAGAARRGRSRRAARRSRRASCAPPPRARRGTRGASSCASTGTCPRSAGSRCPRGSGRCRPRGGPRARAATASSRRTSSCASRRSSAARAAPRPCGNSISPIAPAFHARATSRSRLAHQPGTHAQPDSVVM